MCVAKKDTDSPMSHRAFFSVIIAGLSSVSAGQAASFLQSPGHFGGFGSDGSVFSVADDFQFAEGTSISGLNWWGGYFNPPSGTDPFTVRLYADDGGRPGTLLQQFVFDSVAKESTGQFVNGGPRLYPEFRYSAVLGKPFLAEAGATYWLSIINPPRDTWLWEASASLADLGVQRSFSRQDWLPYFDNAAFELTSVPEPENTVVAGLGVTGLAWILRYMKRLKTNEPQEKSGNR